MARAWPVIKDGQVLEVPRVWFQGCCSCGMVHRLEFFKRGGRLKVRIFTEPRKTYYRRKKKGVKVVKVDP